MNIFGDVLSIGCTNGTLSFYDLVANKYMPLENAQVSHNTMRLCEAAKYPCIHEKRVYVLRFLQPISSAKVSCDVHNKVLCA